MRRYLEYKDSGVEWIGEVPKHWHVYPVFRSAEQQKISNKGLVNQNLLSLSYGNIVNKNRETNFGLLPASFETYQRVFVGNIILRLTDLQNDKRSLRVGLVREDGIITSAYVCLRPKEIDPEYGYQLLHSYDKKKVFYNIGGGVRQTMRFEDLRRLPLLVPPVFEQLKISKFIHHKTKLIDTLIEKKQKQIGLLKEQRAAIINQAVTKGLNPNVKMKDSGVEWLGKVPAHWNIKPLKYLTKRNGIVRGPFGSALKVSFFVKSGFKVYEQKNAIYKDVCLGESFVDVLKYRELERFAVNKGDLIISCSGTIGRIYEIPAEFQAGIINQALLKLSLSNRMVTKFFVHTFESHLYQNLIVEKTQGGAMKNLVGIDNFKSLKFLCPPKDEQLQISSYLDLSTKMIDQTIKMLINKIEAIKEYRTTLISDAVTGKIDVRNEEIP